MNKLYNTKEDIQYLLDRINIGIKPKAEVTFFSLDTSTLEFNEIKYIGFITEIEAETGYCNWILEQNGREMPCVNINCISLF